jgi:serine phosphatase RsbU (regulator of sigma subunit)
MIGFKNCRFDLLILFLFLNFFMFIVEGNSQSGTESLLTELANAEAKSNDVEIANVCNKLGFNYWSAGQLDEAIHYFSRSLKINESNSNKNAVANLNNYLGLIYSDFNQFESSVLHLKKALEIRKSLNDKKNIFAELLNLAIVYRQEKDFNQAMSMLNTGLEIAKEMNDLNSLRRCYGMMAENYESLGNPEKSFEYFNLFATIDKEINRIEQQRIETESKQQINLAQQKTREALTQKEQKEIQLIKTEEELSKEIQLSQSRQMEIELLNKENQIKELVLLEQSARLSNERIIRKAILFGLAISLSFGGGLFHAYRQTQRANTLLAKRNKEINQQKDRIEEQQLKIAEAYGEIKDQNQKINRSLIYAQRIQQAMLSHWDKINDHIPDSMVFFKPRDIVSGDFYYFNEIKAMPNKCLIAAADCTGHGVPGAFMSMIGINLLHEIIELKNIVSPHEILFELNRGIRKSLKQDKSNNKDGMDISLVVYDLESKTLEYSGARNPLIYFQDGKMREIKGNRQSIGGIPDTENKIFSQKVIPVDRPTTFYLFSDGFQDQFGGEKGDKFLSKNFFKMLKEIHQYDWKEQEIFMETHLHRWKLHYPQIDDILIIGFRL